jgi:hypothetical protein
MRVVVEACICPPAHTEAGALPGGRSEVAEPLYADLVEVRRILLLFESLWNT